MRPTAAQLNRMTNTELKHFAERNPNDKELLLAIRQTLLPRTNWRADVARRRVNLLLGVLPSAPVPVPELASPSPRGSPHQPARKHRPYLTRLAVAVGGLLVVGIGHGAGQSIWEAVWPRVIGAP